MAECVLNMDPAYCTICKYGPTKHTPDEIDFSFTAKFDGQCSSCNLPAHIGQRAAKTVKERLIHEDCKP